MITKNVSIYLNYILNGNHNLYCPCCKADLQWQISWQRKKGTSTNHSYHLLFVLRLECTFWYMHDIQYGKCEKQMYILVCYFLICKEKKYIFKRGLTKGSAHMYTGGIHRTTTTSLAPHIKYLRNQKKSRMETKLQ